MENLKETPLAPLHLERGARMVPFAGWSMPVQYSSILEEHRRVRQSVGLFDVSHMGQIRVSGNDAGAFLDYLLVSKLSNFQPDQAAYSILCNSSGGAVDDLIIYCISDKQYLLIVNASNAEKDLKWIQEHAAKFDVEIEDESTAWGLLAIQGPQAIEQIKHAGWHVPEVRFGHLDTTWGDTPVRVCRTGYTGEDGVECLIRSEALLDFTTMLETQFGSEAWCGLGARDSLRLEAGLPLYGHELSEELGPLEARMKWTVDFTKSDFIGKDALNERLSAPDRKITRLFQTADRRIARQGAHVIRDGTSVGTVLSGSLSPTRQRGIGSALVPFRGKSGEWAVDIRGKALPIEWL
ncbi:MAG: glycine cleavage system aminomethyltransferase GcvT [Opitutales bacterium]|nr:glycine cleavage system aminomethyltransferase GcvT [Opitutales bacterium]NRA27905.1 glycine cleavage system aminomethyltransferase GcvT [Opitutales bacterium]